MADRSDPASDRYLPGGIALYDSLSGEDALDYLDDLRAGRRMRRELCERLQMPASVLKRGCATTRAACARSSA